MTTDEEIEHYSSFWLEPEKYYLVVNPRGDTWYGENYRSDYIIYGRRPLGNDLWLFIPDAKISEIIRRMLEAGVEVLPEPEKLPELYEERLQVLVRQYRDYCLVRNFRNPDELIIYHRVSEMAILFERTTAEFDQFYQAIAQQMLAAGAELLDKYPEPKRPHLKKVQRLVWWQHWVAQVKQLFHHL